ncbi:Rha family transcriptional regulator [Halalkalibacter krulwichiae]|uniref:Phage regulatory protein Rha (Phage_pRha) n=1 Tax=Halalkalibacter krulwichiae TaxID=199441 RepID=A0A1X9MFI0_9BACI|nr:Rha family transcriptional regulator [Halalkalibacter krulwichiae]ARK32176.1 Phage regulatory protein Rha (Phage_pRha) [Halalkalibacter krulwichiae]
MSNLVFIENDRVVTDSLTIAEVFDKRHADVLRDIEVQLEKLNEANEGKWGLSNFAQTQYQHPQNKQWYKKFNMSEDAFAIIAMSYVTPEAMKMKVKFLTEFKRMKEELQAKLQPKSQAEVIAMLAQFNVDQERRLVAVEEQLDKTSKKQDSITEILSLNPTEWRKKVTNLLNKIAQKLGGFEAYRNIRNQSYERLEDRARCDLSIRLKNKRSNMALEGASKSKIEKTNNLDVIAGDARLTEIYLAIVKEMAIEYDVAISQLNEGA